MRIGNAFGPWGKLVLGTLGLICLLTSPALAATENNAAADKFSLSLGFEFASGDYGTDQTTDSYRIPLTIDYTPTPRLGFELVIPYLHQSNGATVSLGGMRFSMRNSGSGSGSGMGMGSGSSTSSSSASQSGLGDITLTTGYALVTETTETPQVRALVYAKFPTADEDKGLGTGAFDIGGGFSLAKDFGHWSTYAEALYILPGSSSSYDPNNYWSYQASADYHLTRQLSYGFGLTGATAAFDGSKDALEAQLKVDYWTSRHQSFGGYLAKGLSDGSADYGVGVYGAISF